jgi:hypothetical protein
MISLTRVGLGLCGLGAFACSVYSEDLLRDAESVPNAGQGGTNVELAQAGASSVKTPAVGGVGGALAGPVGGTSANSVGGSASGESVSGASNTGGLLQTAGAGGAAHAGAPNTVVAGNSGHGGAAGSAGSPAVSDPLLTVWNFDQPATPFKALFGTATLTPVGAGAAELPLGLQRGTAKSFGLPALPGGDAAVLYIPRLASEEALLIELATQPNGVHAHLGYISDYTLIWDVLWPLASDGRWRGLYQTSLHNEDDAELFVANESYGGIGVVDFDGEVAPQTWQRLALVVNAATAGTTLSKYIDGELVGEESFAASIALDWAIKGSFLLFADDTRETAGVYLAGFGFAARAYSGAQITALKRPSASGPHVPGN